MAGIIGDPVRHSLSPRLHNAAFAAAGLDWVYAAFPVPAGEAAAALAGMRALRIAGLSVTMPHKAAAAGAVDRLSPAGARLGAINTVVLRDGLLLGETTDGEGFVDALRADPGLDPAGRRAVVLGTGGAARAVCVALADAGVAALGVVGRRPEAVAGAVALAPGIARSARVDEVADADLVVNATPVGMGADSRALPFSLDPARLGPGQSVVDLVYHPFVTPLVAAARERGAAATGGLGMLVHQAARQFVLWTGVPAPLEAMEAAARAALEE